MSRAASLAWLGWRFAVVQPLRKALRRESGRERFARAYFGEGGVPTLAEDREVALAAAACTGCSLCEPRCAVASAAGPPGAMGLQSLFRLHAKHVGELSAAAPILAACEGCSACDDACPSGVPIGRVVAHLGRAARRGEGGA